MSSISQKSGLNETINFILDKSKFQSQPEKTSKQPTKNQEAAGKFLPRVYRFTFSPDLNDNLTLWSLNEMEAVAPSFTHLLDHTIAVFWYLFHEGGKHIKKLTIADLTWTLRFLEAMDTRRINDIEDLTFFIEYIKQVINSRYASMDESKYEDLISLQQEQTIVNSSKYFSLTIEDYLSNPEILQATKREENFDERNPTLDLDPRDALIKETQEKLNEWIDTSKNKTCDDDQQRISMEKLRLKFQTVQNS